MTEKLFGTDGIRGKAGHPPLDAVTVRRVARIVMRRLVREFPSRPLLVARDTRGSGQWLQEEIDQEAARCGVAVLHAGVLPTPAAAWLVPRESCAGGLVISASHNPAEYNGLKFLDNHGLKLSAAEEERVELAVAAEAPEPVSLVSNVPDFSRPVSVFPTNPGFLDAYLEFLLAAFPAPSPPPGLKVVVDCANGAASPVVIRLAERLAGNLRPIFHQPDGTNINDGCGAVQPGKLAAEVVVQNACLGFALDGDADRIIAIDPGGRMLDGDALLYIFAIYLDSRGQLAGRTVVGTIMTNLGLEAALSARGIRLLRVPVGDRHIQSRMRSDGFTLGGESSGHLILGAHSWTGDGLLAGMFLLHILVQSGVELPRLIAGYRPFASRMFNLPAHRQIPLEEIAPLRALLEMFPSRPDSGFRLVVRYSGTEPLLRVLLEAEDLDKCLPAAIPLIEATGQALLHRR